MFRVWGVGLNYILELYEVIRDILGLYRFMRITENWKLPFGVLGLALLPATMKNQMNKNTENELESGIP